MAAKFPYRDFRPGQREVAEQVARAVREGSLLSLRAPTGFGKTAAVVYGLLEGGAERVLWAVRTVNEIDPVVRELRLFGASFTFLFSARRSCPLLRGGDMSNEEFWAACRLARLRGECPYHEKLREVEAGHVRGYVKGHISIHAVEVARDIARFLGVCPFFALRALVADSKFVVATYPYVFRDDIREAALDPLRLEDFALVVDEAHSLLDAHTMAEASLLLEEAEKAVGELRANGADDLASEVESMLARLRSKRPRGPVRLDKKWALGGLAERIDELEDTAESILSRRLMEALGGGSWGRVYSYRLAKWLSHAAREGVELFLDVDERGRLGVRAMPVDPAWVAREPLEKARAAVLMSGTLPPGDFAGELLGVSRLRSFYDVELMAGVRGPGGYVAVVARDVTTRFSLRGPGMYSRIAEYVETVALGVPGAKLVVYPSYEVMKAVVERLPLTLDLVVEDRATSLAEVRRAVMEAGGVVVNAVAGGKLVEGVEFLDYEGRNLLSTVVVVGVPFPQPDVYTDSFLNALAARLGRGRAKFYIYDIQAYVRVAQALGRAIRSPEDKALYILLDYRYLQRRFRELLRLRYHRVVSGPEELAEALSALKARLGWA